MRESERHAQNRLPGYAALAQRLPRHRPSICTREIRPFARIGRCLNPVKSASSLPGYSSRVMKDLTSLVSKKNWYELFRSVAAPYTRDS